MGTALRTVDSIEVTVLVDNVVSVGAPRTHPNVAAPGSWAQGRKTGRLIAAHGFAALVTTQTDGEVHRVLYDTGPSPQVISHNVDVLGIDLSDIEAVVVSHGHWDHMGGLEWVVSQVSRPTTVYIMATAFRRRAVVEESGGRQRLRELDPIPGPDSIEQPSVRLDTREGPVPLAGGTLLASGPVPRVTEYEQGFKGHVAYERGRWVPDERIPDDRFLVGVVRGRGAVVVTGCSHAGIVNILHEVRRLTGAPVYGVVGGLHLVGRGAETRTARTVSDVRSFGPTLVVPCHCSGHAAQRAFERALPDAFVPCGVGLRCSITARD